MQTHCKLQLDNYTGYYSPGQTIQGRIILNFDSAIKCRGVKLTLKFTERTQWLGTESYYDSQSREQKNRDTQFNGDREEIIFKQWVYGDQNASMQLTAGQHVFPFNINLPQNIPSTYQCPEGSVTYTVSANVDRPMAFDYDDNFVVVVNSPVDLNFIARPDDLEPTHYSDEKTVCCWCCAQGAITMDVTLPKKVIIPGEGTEVSVKLTNMSNTNVEGVSLEFEQIFTYKVTDPNREEKTTKNLLVHLQDVGLGAHGDNTYIFKVTLPRDATLPNFTQCNLFSVEYRCTITAQLPSMHRNLEIRMFPKVGHIPLAIQNASTIEPPSGPNIYPTLGWVGGPGNPTPSAPPTNDKSLEASGYPGSNPPPSYDSLNM
ncbi:hypothetical protein ABEB36_007105 [Hypothenemus hampei]|uniref:Arrestin C-terminal-like domain-containing protein n=1 Tax=Hypothenemus hampei TaxID=57062 RepID=A0ABD1EST1_HYPHA